MQDDGVADTFHGCGGGHSLSLDGHGFRSPSPEGVDDHLDVLLVDDEHVGVDPIGILAEGSVIKGDPQCLAADSSQTHRGRQG